MSSNIEMELARQYVEFTNQSVFLTGRAGTGKTTFLRRLRQEQPKRMAVVAPTGVAAINAQGVTIHSFFQIAPGLYLPGAQSETERRKQRYKMSEQKKNILRTLDLLVIDEISMVRCDLLDAIDYTLRSYRDRTKPFGGVQLLMIGDLQQLAPVARDEEWNVLKTQYETPYFFSSKALQDVPYTTIELKKIYRQSDEEFINILSQIRSDTLTRASMDKLNARYIPDFVAPDGEDWIRLTTHNATANAYNNSKLDSLPDTERTFKASIDGNFPATSFPTDVLTTLKVGAQVMFIKNDPTGQQRYYNGKLGMVTGYDGDDVIVACKGEDPIKVGAVVWNNTRYELDGETGQLHEKTDGTFTQIPLRLAWAITIHKSQGLTFDHAVLDVNHSFAHGQTYVALSRCRSLEGLVLSRPLYAKSIICDPMVDAYISTATSRSTHSQEDLPALKQQYFVTLLNELFDFSGMSDALSHVMSVVKKYTFLSRQNFVPLLEEAERLFSTDIAGYSRTFAQQYTAMISATPDYAHSAQLQDRVKAAANYYINVICDQVVTILSKTKLSFTNQEAKRLFSNAIIHLTSTTKTKVATLRAAARDGMSVRGYLNSKACAEALQPALPSNRRNIYDPDGISMARESDTKLKKSKKASTKAKENPKTQTKEEEKKKKTTTYDKTLQLYRQGLSASEIARQRNMTTPTIEKHLAKLVGMRQIDIDELVTPERQATIRAAIDTFEGSYLLSDLKAFLPPDITYAEIKVVIENKTVE